MVSVRESDRGIQIELDDGLLVSCDGYSERADYNFVSHGHADHAIKQGADNIVCSDHTRKISESRFDTSYSTSNSSRIKLLKSGHIEGSRSLVIDDKILYTGDICGRKRAFMNGAEAPPTEIETLIIESTYGHPKYTFPNRAEVRQSIENFLKNTGKPKFLFGYSLGKAQKIQYLVQQTGDYDIVTHGSVKSMNRLYNRNCEIDLNSTSYSNYESDPSESTVFIFPPNTSQADYVENMVEDFNAVKAGFSGWAKDDSYKYRGGYDKMFPLSDHSDFSELANYVKECNPDKVYTTHGFTEQFARYISRNLKPEARALKSNQSNLSDF